MLLVLPSELLLLLVVVLLPLLVLLLPLLTLLLLLLLLLKLLLLLNDICRVPGFEPEILRLHTGVLPMSCIGFRHTIDSRIHARYQGTRPYVLVHTRTVQ